MAEDYDSTLVFSSEEEERNYWYHQVQEWRKSGMTMGKWCEMHGVFSLRFFQRKREKFVPEDIDRTPHEPTSWSTLEMALPASHLDVQVGQATIVVPPGFDQTLLREIVEVLTNED